jgi:hypothetical protein
MILKKAYRYKSYSWLFRIKLFIHKMRHWEYWNTWLLYLPLSPVWAYYSLLNRHFYFFEYANPSFPFGGMAMTQKSVIYQLIPSKYIPNTFLVNTESDDLKSLLSSGRFNFPLIAKPDVGLKGLGVALIKDDIELLKYSQQFTSAFLIQEKISYTQEVGVFYCRYPDQNTGFITGMVQKKFLHIKGDGKHTVRELILQKPRSAMQYKAIQTELSEQMDEVLSMGEKLILVPFGSHTRGAEFCDVSHLVTERLRQTIDHIARQIPGFYYGRFDIMHQNMESLLQGEKFSIIELNGGMSEPTHIYDPKYSIFFAWKEFMRHWKIMSDIARKNRAMVTDTTSIPKGLKLIFQNIKLERQLKKLH